MNKNALLPNICPECGALQRDSLTCWEQLGYLLAWEYYDPALAALHFVTVASSNLQHPAQFTPDALASLRRHYLAHLREGLPVTQIRAATGKLTQGAMRVLLPEAERKIVRRDWPLTIADVALPDQPAGAVARVQAWAELTPTKMERES